MKKGLNEKMDIIKTTNELAEILNTKKLSYIYMKDGEVEIELGVEPPQIVYAGYTTASHDTYAPPAERDNQSAPPVQAAEQAGNFVKSPIIGTFYAAPAPDKPPFVKVGDKVEKGQVVCIVESMKLMNEITSEFTGAVAEILAKDGEAVEFDKKLIRIV
ncbi:MAG: acetyl-CoA carboxylase biotin carboxyl carrier protein [Oscillospiraceae bacterium]|jgi:acetyl-CoA carboxylase biotin carboxyl carrier protein|nr:acetyl-CoA carboxylase biotin carboxyl carrier protein [Oscillospiraceae bacterium]